MADGFCGWYFRCRSQGQILALIPAVHTAGGRRSGSLQIISGAGTRTVSFPGESVLVDEHRPYAVLGDSVFSESGIRLHESREGLSLRGELRFGPLTPLRYHIMGPFCRVPFLECRHSVVSMRHTVSGSLCINGEEYSFPDGLGYLEGDRGRAFPRRYAWTQCFFPGGSLMLSVADVPFGPGSFTGIISVVRMDGKEYRLATYLGARAVKIRDGEIVLRQGALTLSAALLEKSAYPLRAPGAGGMSRSIRENVSCRAEYCFRIGRRTVLKLESGEAAFEYEYPLPWRD